MATTSKFWLVWKYGGGPPTKQHFTEDNAKHEAERLAREFPGQVFYVFEAIRAVKTTAPIAWRQLTSLAEHPHGCQCDDCTIPF